MSETTTSEMTTSGQAYARPDGSALDGYRACAGLIRCALDKAANERPRRRSFKMHRLAAYREGYHAGLLFAHCQLALGEFPLQNADAIKKALEALNIPAETRPASGRSLQPMVGTERKER